MGQPFRRARVRVEANRMNHIETQSVVFLIYEAKDSPGSVVRLLSQAPVLLPLGGRNQEDAMQHGCLEGTRGVCGGGSYRGRSMRLCAHRCELRG
jgi:hypothetical protein